MQRGNKTRYYKLEKRLYPCRLTMLSKGT
jgi:hypothetical protein